MDQRHEKGLLAAVTAWLERLDSQEGLCGAFRRYHSVPHRGRCAETNLTVWHLGTASPEACAAREVFERVGAAWIEFVPQAREDLPNSEFRNLSILSPADETTSVCALESIRAKAAAEWPDLILAGVALDRITANTSPDSIRRLGILLYHLLEPGGMIVAPLSLQSPVAAETLLKLGEAQEFDQTRRIADCIVFDKETSIYTAKTIPVANRSSIFDPGSCEDSALAAFRTLPLQPASRVLDVGVGDGRFSRHFLRQTEARGGEYIGIEMTSKPEIRPKFAEVAARTRFDTNFFCLDEPEQYDLVILFFVFHSIRFWPLFFYHSRFLLKPGGRVMFANRDDRIIRWTHGRFFNIEAAEPSAIRREAARYWNMREDCGVRTFAQTTTIIDRERCSRAGYEMGFLPESVLVVDRLRDYCLDRRQLAPGEDDPAMWNIGRVGLTRTDRQKLSHAFSVETVEEILPENVFVSIMRKA